MGCTKAQVILLLEKIKDEMKDPRDKEVVQRYIDMLRYGAWKELLAEITY